MVDYIKTLDPTQKIKFTMEITEPGNYLEFLDLKFKWENGKITVGAHSKAANSFTYVLPITCYPSKGINNIPHGVALRLRRMCDSDRKFKHWSEEYKNYLIAWDYHPGLVDKQFQKVEMTSRHECAKLRASRTFVPYVLHVPMCLTCLRAFASYVPSFFPVPYVPSFFTCLTCLQFFRSLHFFMCLTCLHFLRALRAFIFLRTLRAFNFSRALRTFIFYVLLSFYVYANKTHTNFN